MSPAAPVMVLKSRQFRQERESSWQELESLLTQMKERGIGALSPEQLERFPLLYRSALSSLSVARSIALDRALVEYLNNLSLRAYLTVYAPPRDLGRGIASFVWELLPRAVQAMRWHVAIMVAILLLGTVSGFVLVDRDEAWFNAFVPAGMAGGRGPLSTTAELRKILATGLPDASATVEMVANALFAHNTAIGLLMFGLGPLAGIPTVLLCLTQGLLLGAFLALHAHHGLLLEFTGWVSIHGVTELTALILFGAAGLKLGELLVFPGRHTRAENFAIHGPMAGVVAVGGAAMLFVAAILEGVFRQAIINTDARLAVALATLIFWILYFSHKVPVHE